MPQKRPHRKSRLGCEQCRKRRVKCDEQHPRCTNCVNREDECVYSLVRRPSPSTIDPGILNRTPSSQSVASTSTSLSDPYSRPASFPSRYGSTPITNVALMHYWCTKTCHSFTRKGTELFRDHVPSLAFQHDYLLNAIFAVTLLHQASVLDDPVEMRPLVDSALQHQNLAVFGLSQNLDAVSSQNCEAVFMSSVLVMVCAIVAPLLPHEGQYQHHVPSTFEIVQTLITMMNGISSVLDLARPWIEFGPLHHFFGIVERGPLHKSHGPVGVDSAWHPAVDLRHMILSRHDPHWGHQYETAIDGLERVASDEISAVSWVMNYGTALADALEDNEPLAVLIFKHWAVLLCTTDEMWWKKYAGIRLVEELSGALNYSATDVRVDRMIRRCKREAGLHGLWSCPGSYLFGSMT